MRLLPLILALPLGASAGTVTPASVSLTLDPGESTTLTKSVTLDDVPPSVQVLLLVDVSGSYYDDIGNLQSSGGNLAADVFDSVCGAVGGSCEFGLASFSDFPFYPWGYSPAGDYAYQLEQDFTSDRATFVSAVDSLTLLYGTDYPEAQYEGIYQAVTGAGLDIDGDGLTDKLGEIDAGLAPTWASDVTRILIVTTDASFHEGGEACTIERNYSTYVSCGDDAWPNLDADGTGTGYPGATQADTIAALQDAGVHVIGLTGTSPARTGTTGTTLTELDDLADATGGASLTTASDSSDITSAILSALDQLTFTVSADAGECEAAGVGVELAPASYDGVAGGETVDFDETITAPADCADIPAGTLSCGVDFLQDDAVLGTQTIELAFTDSDGDGITDACDDCPWDADNDLDGDGLCGDVDACPDSDWSFGEAIDDDGCSIADYCPCDGPSGLTLPSDDDDDSDSDGSSSCKSGKHAKKSKHDDGDSDGCSDEDDGDDYEVEECVSDATKYFQDAGIITKDERKSIKKSVKDVCDDDDGDSDGDSDDDDDSDKDSDKDSGHHGPSYLGDEGGSASAAGCSTTGGSPAGLGLLFLAGLGLVARRRD